MNAEKAVTAIPTISATVGGGSGSIEAVADSIMSPSVAPKIKDIVQQKFKDNEKVFSVFETYQIIGPVDLTRYLVLVYSEAGGTGAIFSLTAARSPPSVSNDLTIDKIFPLNEGFRFNIDSKDSISKFQFDLKNADEFPVRFYYYAQTSEEDACDFETFQAQVISVKTMVRMVPENVLSYSWIYDYRQIGEVKQELKRREHEYIIFKDFTVYCATWNVNDKSCYGNSPLHLWLAATKTPPDIYAIALQEMDTSTKALAFNESRPDMLWVQKMLESANKAVEYEELTSVRLVGIMLTILIRKQIRPLIARCRVKSISRGLLNVLGNKGGVAVSIQLNEGSICFVNSHLEAHMERVLVRNEQQRHIEKLLQFDNELCKTINDHDHIFWIGDLNYRIEEPAGLQLDRTAENVFETLMQFDQLHREMRSDHCFHGYSEGPIHFKPTYKYDVGTDNFDSSEKQRAPAYCDRVLYKGVRIEQLAYKSVMDIRQSDHKPVYALFNVKIKTKDERRYKRVHEEVLKLVDKRENENQPQIIVEKNIIDFGVVRFNETVVSEFAVSNTCPMPVEFVFKVKDPPLNDICEKWLSVEPKAEILQTDTSKIISVKIKPDIHCIRGLLSKLRTTHQKFDFDILILDVKNGRDIFITVTGEYKPSCFGLSMETLCRTNRPISDYTQAEVKQLMNMETSEFSVTMPREFFLLIDYLHRQGSKVEGAFASLTFKNVTKQMNAIRDWLDTWSEKEFPGTPHAAAEALLLMLDLPEKPLLHPYVEGLLHTNSADEAMEIIAQLSSPKRNVFMHLRMFLRAGIERGFYNLPEVAAVFGNVLLRDNTKIGQRNNYHQTLCYEFMCRFITSDMEASLSPPSTSSKSTTMSAAATAAAGKRTVVGENNHESDNAVRLNDYEII